MTKYTPNATDAVNEIFAHQEREGHWRFNQRAAVLFSRYSPAYVVSNENLHDVIQRFMPKQTQNALTVAASGDHPMICKLYGAKNIKTFDISYNAKVLMDIKFVAIPMLNIGDYNTFLENIRRNPRLLSVPHMDKIMPKLNPEVRQYIRNTNGVRLFSMGRGPQSYMRYALMPTEYNTLQNITKKPFDFEWSDIADLKMDGMYDFIHLSNVLDYVEYDKLTPILRKIQEHVNVGGRIVIMVMADVSTRIWLQDFESKQRNWKILSHGRVNVLERVR